MSWLTPWVKWWRSRRQTPAETPTAREPLKCIVHESNELLIPYTPFRHVCSSCFREVVARGGYPIRASVAMEVRRDIKAGKPMRWNVSDVVSERSEDR